MPDVLDNGQRSPHKLLSEPRVGAVPTTARLRGLMLEHAFRFVSSVVFLIHPENVRSQRAIEKIGAVGWGRVGCGVVVATARQARDRRAPPVLQGLSPAPKSRTPGQQVDNFRPS